MRHWLAVVAGAVADAVQFTAGTVVAAVDFFDTNFVLEARTYDRIQTALVGAIVGVLFLGVLFWWVRQELLNDWVRAAALFFPFMGSRVAVRLRRLWEQA